MSRTLTGSVSAALAASHLPYLMFVYLDYPSGVVRACNAAYDVSWDGYTWLGAALVGGIGDIEEGADLEARALTLTLSGIPPDMISATLGDHYQGRTAKIWLAPLGADYQVLADPVLVFEGRMDTSEVSLGDTASIRLSCVSRLVDWDRPRVRHYNNADQQQAYSGDLGMEYVEATISKDLKWGRA